jgi:hypothetical protein
MAFSSGDRVQCTGNPVNVRSSTDTNSTTNIIGSLTNTDLGTVQSSSPYAGVNNSFTWWYVKWDKLSQSGYTAGQFLQLVTASQPGTFTLSNDLPVYDTSIPGPKVNLTWGASSNATSYDVYRNGSVYSSGVTQLSFLNSANLTAGQSYSYYVIAKNSAGTRQSNTINVTMPNAPASQPGSFTLSNDTPVYDTSIPGPKVNLNWGASSNATSYDVYRNGSIYSSGITQLSFLNSANLTAGQSYSYYIIAKNSAGTRQSNTINVTMPNAPASQPGAFTLSNDAPVWDTSIPGPKVNLIWGASSNATSYDLYRDGSLYSTGITQLSFLNSANLTGGQSYSYYVIAKNSAGTRQSNTINVTMPAAPVSQPGAFTLSNDAPVWDTSIPGPKVNLTWGVSSNATSYDVYRNGSLYSAGVTQLSFLNSANLTGGQSYSYYVIAKNSAGTRQSNTINVTMPNVPASQPGSFTLSNDPPVYDTSIPGPKVNLTWGASSNATSYDVYRNGSVYSSGVTQLSFLNSANLTGGQSYSYYVIGKNSAGTRQSNTINVTMPTAPVTNTPDSYEPDDSPTASKTISNGQNQNRSIHAAGNADWAKFIVGSNGATNVAVETNGASGDTEVWLYGPNSSTTLVAYNDDGNGLFSRISLASLAAGTYYVKVQAYGNNSTIAAYTLRALWTDGTLPVADGNDTPSSATAVANGATVNAAIAPVGDIDWFRFTVGGNGATSVLIETNGSGGDTELWLYGPNGSSTQVAYNDDGNGLFSRISLSSLAAGTYYVKVQAYGNNSTIAAYTLRASWTDVTTVPSDGNDTSVTATTVTNNSAASAEIGTAGDIDWYQFTIGSNGATSVVVETNGSGGDTVMWLYGPGSASTQVAYNDDGNGLFSRINLASLGAGTYYVKVQAYGNTSTIAAYTLRTAWTDGTPPVADGNDSPSTATAVNNRQTASAAINLSTDVDWYRFVVGANGASDMVIETAGSSGDTEMWLYGPNGSSTQIAYNDDSNGNFARINLASLAAGTYYVKVQSYRNNSTIAAYTIRTSWTDRTSPDSTAQVQALHNAMDNLNRTSGSCTFNGITRTDVWADDVMTYCARFARMCLGRLSKFPDAVSLYRHYESLGLVNGSDSPPSGAVVFYDAFGTGSSKYGHTGIADGSGGVYSAYSLTYGITLRPTLNFGQTPYRGYVTADVFIANY